MHQFNASFSSQQVATTNRQRCSCRCGAGLSGLEPARTWLTGDILDLAFGLCRFVASSVRLTGLLSA